MARSKNEDFEVTARRLVADQFDDKRAAAAFDLDLDSRYLAEPIVYVFQTASHILLDIGVSLLGSYLFYRLFQQDLDAQESDRVSRRIQEHLDAQRAELEAVLAHIRQLERKNSRRPSARLRAYELAAKRLARSGEEIVLRAIEARFEGLSPEQMREVFAPDVGPPPDHDQTDACPQENLQEALRALAGRLKAVTLRDITQSEETED